MAEKQNVGGIEVTASVDLAPLEAGLNKLKEVLAPFDDRKFTVTGDLQGSFFKDLDKAIQKLAAGAKAPVQLDAAQNASAKLQEQLNKMNDLEAKVASFEVANDAAASIQAFLDSQKFVAKISKFEIDENSLAEQIQTALTGRKFKLDVDIGEVTGTVTPGKGASAAAKAAATTPAQPAKPAPAATAAQTAAQAAGIDPAKIAEAVSKAIAAAMSGTAPAARTAAAKAKVARGPETTVSEAIPGAFGLRRDVSSAAEWAARTSSPIPAIRQQLEGGGRIQYRGFSRERYDLPAVRQPSEPRGFYFSKAMAAARPDIAMVLADAGVAPGTKAPKEAALQVGRILLQEEESEARDAALKSIYRSAMDPFAFPGGAGGLFRHGAKRIGGRRAGRKSIPMGTANAPGPATDNEGNPITSGGRSASLNAGMLVTPSIWGPAARWARSPAPRTAWHGAEGVQFDQEFIDRVEGLITGQGTATGRTDTPAIAQARARAAQLERQESRTAPEEETLAKLRATLSSFDTSQTLGVTGVGREANWQEARELLRPRMAKLREDVVNAGHNPREFFAGVRRSMEGRIQEGGKIGDIGPEIGPLELEAITLTQMDKDLEIAQERRTGGRVSKRGGRYGVAGAPMGKFETGIVTPGDIPRALTEAAASAERSQFRGEPGPDLRSEQEQLTARELDLQKRRSAVLSEPMGPMPARRAAMRRQAYRQIDTLVNQGKLPALKPIAPIPGTIRTIEQLNPKKRLQEALAAAAKVQRNPEIESWVTETRAAIAENETIVAARRKMVDETVEKLIGEQVVNTQSERNARVEVIDAELVEVREKLKTASNERGKPVEKTEAERTKSRRGVARKAKSARRKALGVLGARVAEAGTDRRPEVGLLSARGKLFQRLFEGDAYKRVEELRNLESMTGTAAVEGYGIATGTEEVPPEIAEMLRNEARKKFVENLPAEDADLFTQARGIEDLSPEHAERWRSLYGGLMQERGAEAAAFDERHGKKPRARRAAATPAAEPTPAGTVTDINEYRAFRKKGGGIGWLGPKGFVAQRNVPAENVASEMLRIGGAASGVGSSAIPPGAVGAGGGGGGGGKVYDVRVRNFNELNRLLTGTTQQGALGAIFRKGASPMEKMDFQGTPEEAIAKFAGGDKAKFDAILRGEAKPEEAAAVPLTMLSTTPSGLKTAPSPWVAAEAAKARGIAQGVAAYNAAIVPATPRGERQSMYEKLWAQADKEADTKSAKESARMQREAEAYARKMEATPKPRTAKEPPKPKVKDIDNPEDDLLKYAAKVGYAIAPRTGAADRRAQAQQEIAQQYGEFNLQRQMLPERAPGVAFAQVFARLTGVKGRMEAAAGARETAERELLTAKELRMADEGRLEAVQKVKGALKESLASQSIEMRKAGKSSTEISSALATQSKYYRDAIVLERDLTKKVEERGVAEGKAVEKLKETDTALSKAGGKMASFSQIGALFVGAKAFMVFNQALDQTIQLASDVGSRSVDQMLGFQATNDKVTKSLAQQITAFHGNTLAALGQTAAMAGLSDAAAKFVGQYAQPNALAMAGSAANMQASDLMRAATYRATGQGKYMGYAPGLFEGTGGILGGPVLAEQMGGTPGLLERSANDLAYLSSKILEAGASTIARRPPEIPLDMLPLGGYAAGVPGVPDYLNPANQAGEVGVPNTQALDEFTKAQTTYIDDLNAAMSRGATRMGETLEVQFKAYGQTADAIDEPVRKAMQDAGKVLGGAAEDNIKKLITAGIGIEGLTGKTQAEQGKAIGDAMEQLAQGRVTPDRQQYMNIQKQQLDAQLAGIEMQRVFQSQFVMPAQVSLERLMNPPTPIAAGTAEMAAVIPTGGPQPVKGGVPNFTAEIAEIQKLQDANQAYAQKAKVLEIINPDDRRNAEGLLDTLISMGAEMQKISTASAKMSGELAAAQYKNQRRIMVRELEDALALSGQVNNAGVGYLGILQRQQVMLDRSNQSLSLQAQQLGIMLSQRQINFQRAVAGFVTPGVTGEERAAAIEQARIEADYAQKQLDIQKQQATIAQKSYKLNIKIFDESVKRQITDLRAGLGLLDKNYITNIEIKLNEDKLKEIDKSRQVVAAKLNGYISAGIERQNLMISTAVSAAATISGSVADFYKTVTTMTNSYFTSVALWMQTVANGGTPPGTTKGGGGGAGGKNQIKNASGSLGTYSSPTSMLVGEAGTETVAILRNPRSTSATPMGGGGGVTVVINVSGNSIRDDRDIDILTDRIERKLNMKASLLGFRKPV